MLLTVSSLKTVYFKAENPALAMRGCEVAARDCLRFKPCWRLLLCSRPLTFVANCLTCWELFAMEHPPEGGVRVRFP